MLKIILDGKKMTSRATAHAYLKEKLEFPSYYGENLDALWDLLSTYSDPIQINLIHTERLIASLGDYGESLIEVFQDAEEENNNLNFVTHG